ncbi:MAG: RNA-binding protein [Prolixibacteraceae bacterium]|jgi:RNA recognition motif-containing protein|nr:RNA-binding protein [Prolixibacteraceae bacterium]
MDIFVAKLSSDTNADHLTELFSQFGTVLSAKVIIDKETGRSKCYGFVEMENDTEVTSAIEQLNNIDFMGSEIAVKKSEPRSRDKRSSNRHFGNNDGRRNTQNRHHFNDRNEGGDRRNSNRDRNFNRYE